MSTLKIGIVGYSGQKFDESTAKRLLEKGIATAIDSCNNVTSVEIVSGLTNLGIPAIAYAIAKENELRTAGIACEKARNYDCFPVDREVIVGSEWGDESDTFLSDVDVIVRVGGGVQSLREVETFRESGGTVYEYELEAIPA